MNSPIRTVGTLVSVAALVCLTSCGGGGGEPSGSGPTGTARSTKLRGSMSAPVVGQHVCVEDTSFCSEIDENGQFELEADVGGDLVLVFEGQDFTARLALTVPAGATVRIQDIHCSTVTGRCSAGDVVIVGAENAPPVCDSAVASPATLWPPNHQLVPIAIRGVFDPDDDPVEIEVTEVFQDEVVAEPGAGSGNTAPDAIADPLSLRAERGGQGNGRVYLVVFDASDGLGGFCEGAVVVCVPHDQGNGSGCIDDGDRFNSLSP